MILFWVYRSLAHVHNRKNSWDFKKVPSLNNVFVCNGYIYTVSVTPVSNLNVASCVKLLLTIHFVHNTLFPVMNLHPIQGAFLHRPGVPRIVSGIVMEAYSITGNLLGKVQTKHPKSWKQEPSTWTVDTSQETHRL